MVELVVSGAWKETYPGASVDLLAMHGVSNPAHHAALDDRKEELEQQLRSRFAHYDRAMIKALPVIQAYNAYYRRFKKTYHVQLQLESLVLKGKPIARVAALVEAMFMAELNHLLLTAGHDLHAVRPPVTIHVADGNECFVRINGQEQQLKQGDMFIADTQGILSSVIYGPDLRTQITSATHEALFTVYTPPGIDQDTVYEHLCDIRDSVLLVAPAAQVMQLQVFRAE